MAPSTLPTGSRRSRSSSWSRSGTLNDEAYDFGRCRPATSSYSAATCCKRRSTIFDPHHSAALRQLGAGSSLPPQVFQWAERLARTPEAVSAADIAMLREVGLSDRAILDAVLTVAYFSYANRLVMGLGLSLEAGFEATCRPDLPAASD